MSNALERARQNIEDSLVIMAHLGNPAFMKEIRGSLREQKEPGEETDVRIEKLFSAIGAFIAKA